MKITICGSIAFFNEMKALQQKLEKSNHQVEIPRDTILNEAGTEIPSLEFYQLKKGASANYSWMWHRVQENIVAHFEKIAWAEAILVANYTKNDIQYYISGNTLIEMGVALFLGKRIYLLNPIPEVAYKEEVLAMQPIVLNNNLKAITHQ